MADTTTTRRRDSLTAIRSNLNRQTSAINDARADLRTLYGAVDRSDPDAARNLWAAADALREITSQLRAVGSILHSTNL